ncbi:MAG: cupin domain-containing protein [Fidelibacterota bacterium]
MNEVIVKSLTEADIKAKGIKSWPIWSCGMSEFHWEYELQESCYLLEGEVIIETDAGKQIKIQSGDFVIFPKGLKCTWRVLRPVNKHYSFQ